MRAEVVSTRLATIALRVACAVILAFLAAPVFIILPLSFNSEPYFTYPLAGLSTRWYSELLSSTEWRLAARNSLIIGVSATVVSTVLGTLAALGLNNAGPRVRAAVFTLVISPLIMPVIIL